MSFYRKFDYFDTNKFVRGSTNKIRSYAQIRNAYCLWVAPVPKLDDISKINLLEFLMQINL